MAVRLQSNIVLRQSNPARGVRACPSTKIGGEFVQRGWRGESPDPVTGQAARRKTSCGDRSKRPASEKLNHERRKGINGPKRLPVKQIEDVVNREHLSSRGTGRACRFYPGKRSSRLHLVCWLDRDYGVLTDVHTIRTSVEQPIATQPSFEVRH